MQRLSKINYVLLEHCCGLPHTPFPSHSKSLGQYGKVQRELPGSTLPLGGSPLELLSSTLPLSGSRVELLSGKVKTKIVESLNFYYPQNSSLPVGLGIQKNFSKIICGSIVL